MKRASDPDPDPEHEVAKWTKVVGIWTRWLVAVGVLTAVVLALQLCVLKQTDETARLRDRAFIYFGDPVITPYPPGNPVVWGVTVAVRNAGNMPARRVTVRYACPDVLQQEEVRDPFPLAKWEKVELASVIGPKNGFVLQGCNIPIESINNAKKSLRVVFYVLEARYIDGFDLDTPRITQMSRIFRFDQWGGQSLGFLGPHNCSDEDCPK